MVGAPAGEDPSFQFNGSISYDPNGFQLANGQSQDFYRAGGATWNVTESSVAGYRLTSVTCTATNAQGGAGESTTTVAGGTTSINLVSGEHVRCVYTNQFVPPAGGLVVRKVTPRRRRQLPLSRRACLRPRCQAPACHDHEAERPRGRAASATLARAGPLHDQRARAAIQ